MADFIQGRFIIIIIYQTFSFEYDIRLGQIMLLTTEALL